MRMTVTIYRTSLCMKGFLASSLHIIALRSHAVLDRCRVCLSAITSRPAVLRPVCTGQSWCRQSADPRRSTCTRAEGTDAPTPRLRPRGSGRFGSSVVGRGWRPRPRRPCSRALARHPSTPRRDCATSTRLCRLRTGASLHMRRRSFVRSLFPVFSFAPRIL